MVRKVCILLPPIGVYPALGTMLEETFSGLGWRVTVRHDAGVGALDHDVLLMAGLCRYIDGLADVLKRRRGRRPITVLWQLEPLPPARLSPLGERTGFRVAACDWGRLPRPLRRTLGCFVPFRTKFMRLLRRGLARPYSGPVVSEPDQEGWIAYDDENYFNALADWRWIKAAHAHGWLDFCFDSVEARVQFLRSRGIQAELVPFGYHPRWGRDLQESRDVDALFLGRADRGPRGAALRRLQEQLARRGRTLSLVRHAQGSARERLLNRARIMVNLLRAPHDLAGMRVLLGMACGALVVSEHCDTPGAFEPGRHFVMVPADRLPEAIDYYLAHEEERRLIAREGHRFVTRELTLSNAVGRILARAAM